MPCPCGVDAEQPWRKRGHIWSPASFIGGLVLLAFGIAVALYGKAWFGWTVVSLLGSSVVVASLIQAVRGHRATCLVRRGTWFGLAAPGAPLRLFLP
jgi:hypothetical protein